MVLLLRLLSLTSPAAVLLSLLLTGPERRVDVRTSWELRTGRLLLLLRDRRLIILIVLLLLELCRQLWRLAAILKRVTVELVILRARGQLRLLALRLRRRKGWVLGVLLLR